MIRQSASTLISFKMGAKSSVFQLGNMSGSPRFYNLNARRLLSVMKIQPLSSIF